jgi:hypothetical protein
MIGDRMEPRLGACKIERKHFGSNKPIKEPPDELLSLCHAGGIGPLAGEFRHLILSCFIGRLVSIDLNLFVWSSACYHLGSLDSHVHVDIFSTRIFLLCLTL